MSFSETINKLKARVIEERDRQKEKNETYKQSSAQNFKINEIAKNLKSGKIVGEKIISRITLIFENSIHTEILCPQRFLYYTK
ncbi:hypothetical protein VN0754_11170 [Helicobacter pylori]|nr:hypothetical protein VN0754_11170 [Helicobacter pylori]